MIVIRALPIGLFCHKAIFKTIFHTSVVCLFFSPTWKKFWWNFVQSCQQCLRVDIVVVSNFVRNVWKGQTLWTCIDWWTPEWIPNRDNLTGNQGSQLVNSCCGLSSAWGRQSSEEIVSHRVSPPQVMEPEIPHR